MPLVDNGRIHPGVMRILDGCVRAHGLRVVRRAAARPARYVAQRRFLIVAIAQRLRAR